MNGPGVRSAALVLVLVAGGACGERSDPPAPPPDSPVATPAEQEAVNRVVDAALSAIDTLSLPWPFIQSFMVNTAVSGVDDPYVSEGDPQASLLDLLGLQDRGYAICTACADSTRLAHAWVTAAAPVRESIEDWLVPYTFSVQKWGTRSGRVRVRCLGGACRATEAVLDSAEVPTPSCCPVFVRVRRPRR